MDFQIGQSIALTITGFTHEGNGVGKKDGFVFFVPFCALGEVVECVITKLNKNYGEAKVSKIIKRSPARLESDCPHFTVCGGCCYRHITYEEELSIKTQYVRDSLQKLASCHITVPDCIPSPQVLHYRNNCQTPVATDENGTVYSGFRQKNSHKVLNTQGCLLEPPLFSQIRTAVCRFIETNHISVYSEKTNSGLVRNIFLRCSENTKSVYLTLVLNGTSLPREKEFVAQITAQFSQICGITLNTSPHRHTPNLGGKNRVIFGTTYLEDSLAGVSLHISPNSFYQVNRPSAENLYSQVAQYAQVGKEDTLVDLYCGTGSIGLSLAAGCKELIGVDIVRDAVENAKQNALQNRIYNTRFICADAAQAAMQFAKEQLTPDVIIVDPPRKGCERKVLDCIVQMAPKKLVVVSCNPSTLARDLAHLQENGFALQQLQPFDLFPRTSHVECIVLLQRKDT